MFHAPAIRGCFIPLCFELILLCSAPAAEPVLNGLFPAGGQQGAEIEVKGEGKFDPWPPAVWTSGGGVDWEADEHAGQFKARIDSSAPLGPQWVRLHNAEGASEPRLFVVGRVQEKPEREPNNRHAEAMEIDELPVTINGRLEKSEDVDCFAVNLKAGQWLVAAVDAYGLRSPLDPHLHLFEASGRRVAFENDSANLDPLLAYRAEKNERYVLQLAAFAYPPEANIRFAGAPAAIYRLTLTAGPFGCRAFPSAIHRDEASLLRVNGWNLGADNLWTNLQAPASYEMKLDVAPWEWPRPVYVDVSDAPQALEAEPNNTTAEAMKIVAPVWVHGRLDPAGDEDRFKFNAGKGERLTLRVESLDIGFMADTLLVLERAGEQLARSDDHGDDRDPSLDWTAKEPGEYTVVVRELFGRGGTGFAYRLAVEPSQSDFVVSAAQSSVKVAKGKEAELKLILERLRGHTAHLDLLVEGLPDDVEAKAGEVPIKGKDVSVTFSAKEKAAPFSGPIQVWVSEGGDGPRHAAWVDLREDKLRGSMLLNGTDQLWLTVE